MRSLRLMPSTRSLIAVGWSPFGSYSDLISKRHAAFGFFRARRPVRRPHFQGAVVLLEFGTALADQVLQRFRGGLDAERLHLVARRPRQRLVVILGGRQAELPRQFGIERRDGGRGAVIGLRGFVEAFGLLPPPAGRGALRSPLPLARGGGGVFRSVGCRALRHHRPCRGSRRGRDARPPRRRRGDPRNCPAAAAARWTSRCQHRRD